MIENTQNNFKKYIDPFIFYIISINYTIFTYPILIFVSIPKKTNSA